jgi:hypothetical protein
MASDGRSYVTGYFAMDLDGVKCGVIHKLSGGDVEDEPTILPGENVKYSDFTVDISLSMAQPVKDWIDASLAMNYMRKSGELIAADLKREVRHIREFKDALLTEITFPACDGAAKDAAFMSLKFSPWIVRNKKGDGSKIDDPGDTAGEDFHLSDFRFTIEGLEEACARVSRIEPITIKQTVVRDDHGQVLVDRSAAPKRERSKLRLTLPEEHAASIFAWHEDFVRPGVNQEGTHKSGSLVYLNRTRQKELLTLTFSGLGIFKISAAPRANNEDKIAQVTVELYYENLLSQFG